MARQFDPQKVLKQLSNSLLCEFFTQRGELDDVPWNDLTEHKVEPIFAAWQALPEPQMIEVQTILRDINQLADHRGLAVLSEEILGRCPERSDEFESLTGKADKAMWVYLNVPDAFDEAALFARADALASGRYWVKRNSLPQMQIDVTEAMRNDLGVELTSYYGPVQMRGRRCHVVHYRRQGGAEYFFAYLDDYADKRLVFADGSDQPIVRSDRLAFENVFVYNSMEGSMELYAPGGRKVQEPLQSAFCKAVLGEDIPPADPLRPSYMLDHLLARNYPLPTEPGDQVEEARITRMRLVPSGSGGHVEVKADLRGDRNDIYRKIDRWLRHENIPIDGTRVTQVTFSLRFVHSGAGRQPTLTFDVSAPHSSNLKSKPDEQRAVGERCLRRWGVTSDGE